MGDASAEGFKHMSAGLKALLANRAPFGEQRNGLGFEDCQGNTLAGVLCGKGETEFIANGGADHAIGGQSAPEKRREVGIPTDSQEKAPTRD